MDENNTERRILWSIRVTRHLNDLLDRYIEVDAYQTKSEFVRTAVRDRLREEMAKIGVEVSP